MTKDVVIVGVGPGGLAAARWLKSRGFTPRLYEAHSEVGGQWSWTNPNSGVWPQMVTNTFIEATRFSDLEFPPGTPLFPHNATVRQYFEDFARQFGIFDHIRFDTRLTRLQRDQNEWTLTLETSGAVFEDHAEHVVIATGRFNDPMIPDIPGLASFTGDMGVIHSFDYKDPMPYQGQRVAVLGGSISSLEIASDLSMLGAAAVYLCQRRQRYVNPKMFLGTPIEFRLFTHERGRLALDDPDAFLRDSEAKIMEHAGDPSRYGTPKPHPRFALAGATGSQHYLNLVAEGRVKPQTWPDRVDGRTLIFPDESSIDVDGLVAGTGFRLNLPFLADDLVETLKVSDNYIELDEFTFHPDLPGLAFMGLWSQAGSYPTPLEQQARFLTYTWSGELPRSQQAMRDGIRRCQTEGHHSKAHNQAEMALRFARLSGTDPAALDEAQGLAGTSATCGTLYRVCGPDALDDALNKLCEQKARFCGGQS